MTPHDLEDQRHSCARKAVAGALLPACMMLAVGCQQDARLRRGTAWEKPQNSRVGALRPKGEPSLLPVTHFASAQLLEESGDLTGALRQYRQAIALNHDFMAAYERLALLLDRMGHYYEAEQVWLKAIERAPNNPSLHNNLGFHHLMQRKYRQAAESFDNALMADPTYDRARVNLGITLAQMGQIGEALEFFREALPEDQAQYNLGLVLRQNLKHAEARRAFEAALRANPRLTAARVHLAELSSPAAGVDERRVATTGPPAAGAELTARDEPDAMSLLDVSEPGIDESMPSQIEAAEPEPSGPPVEDLMELTLVEETETELAAAPTEATEPIRSEDAVIPQRPRVRESESAWTAASTEPTSKTGSASPPASASKPGAPEDLSELVEDSLAGDPGAWEHKTPTGQTHSSATGHALGELEPVDMPPATDVTTPGQTGTPREAPEPEPMEWLPLLPVETPPETPASPAAGDPESEPADEVEVEGTGSLVPVGDATTAWAVTTEALATRAHERWVAFVSRARQYVQTMWSGQRIRQAEAPAERRLLEDESVARIADDGSTHGEIPKDHPCWGEDRAFFEDWEHLTRADWPSEDFPYDLEGDVTAQEGSTDPAAPALSGLAADHRTPAEHYRDLLADEDLSLAELVAAEVSGPMRPSAPVISETRTSVDFDDVDDAFSSPANPVFGEQSHHRAALDQADPSELQQLMIPQPKRESNAATLEPPADAALPWELSRQLPDSQLETAVPPARRPADCGPIMLTHDHGLSRMAEWVDQRRPTRPIPPPMR